MEVAVVALTLALYIFVCYFVYACLFKPLKKYLHRCYTKFHTSIFSNQNIHQPIKAVYTPPKTAFSVFFIAFLLALPSFISILIKSIKHEISIWEGLLAAASCLFVLAVCAFLLQKVFYSLHYQNNGFAIRRFISIKNYNYKDIKSFDFLKPKAPKYGFSIKMNDAEEIRMPMYMIGIQDFAKFLAPKFPNAQTALPYLEEYHQHKENLKSTKWY